MSAAQTPAMSVGQFLRSLWRILAGRPSIPPALQDNAPLQTVLNRRSVRRFTAQQIPEDVFTAILEAARVAPSTVNLQSWAFAVFSAQTWQAAFGRGIPFKAPRAVVVLGDMHRNRGVLQAFPRSPLVEYTVAVMNASLAAMNMTVAASALGVGSVMLSETGRSGLLDAGYLREKLGLPAGVFPLMTIVFGYPASAAPPMPPRLPLEEICFEGVYREADPQVMAEWLRQMTAGYKASFPFSSLEAQLGVYQSKIGQAEADLRQMVFGENTDPKGF